MKRVIGATILIGVLCAPIVTAIARHGWQPVLAIVGALMLAGALIFIGVALLFSDE